MAASEGPWEIVEDRAKNVEADAEAPKVVAKVADVGEGGGEVVKTPVVRFGDLQYPPAASSTARKAWYPFKPEHGLGPLIAGGWHHAQSLWQSTGHRWPRGYTNLDDAVAGLLADWKTPKPSRSRSAWDPRRRRGPRHQPNLAKRLAARLVRPKDSPTDLQLPSRRTTRTGTHRTTSFIVTPITAVESVCRGVLLRAQRLAAKARIAPPPSGLAARAGN